ncbi:MAG TPA: hypothetical protein VG848_04740 [Acetobacteraceae bacterium]|nr:hypothetical protein [Acetobacteraceae bacterium]
MTEMQMFYHQEDADMAAKIIQRWCRSKFLPDSDQRRDFAGRFVPQPRHEGSGERTGRMGESEAVTPAEQIGNSRVSVDDSGLAKHGEADIVVFRPENVAIACDRSAGRSLQ